MSMHGNRKVWIRADGNEEIASGHLRRMLSVAEELRREGCEVQFLFADDGSRNRFLEITDTNRNRWPYLQLGVPYGNPMKELEYLRPMLDNGRPDWLIVDSYAVTEEFFSALREGMDFVRVAYIDDLRVFDPDVDLVINYAPDVKTLQRFYRKAGKRLLGPRYAPLRAQFSHLEPKVREEVRRILVVTGGSDPYGMAASLEALVQEEGLEAAVAAPGHPYVEKMAAMMQSCDLAVSAGGTTLYELCAAGVPTLCWTMADNQVRFAGAMAASGACTLAGDVRDPKGRADVLQKVLPWIRERNESETGRQLRTQEAERMHALTDGRGAQRIAREFLRNG